MKKLFFVVLALITLSFNAFAAVNINTASKEELESLKGVGPSKAKAIIDYRTKNGPFKTADDLNNVPGFGDKSTAKLKSSVTVSGKTTADTAVAEKAKKAAVTDKKAN
jgi:competence protein ComEA